MSELVDRLDMARRVVEAGWTKNKMHNPERTHFCALGALDLVCTAKNFSQTGNKVAALRVVHLPPGLDWP